MKPLHYFFFGLLFLIIIPSQVPAQDSPIRIDFSGATAKANGLSIFGASNNTLPQAPVFFGPLPKDHFFEGATDGWGAVVIAQPGQGVMIYGKTISTPYNGIIRCTVRMDSPEGEVALTAIDSGPSTFVGTIRPNNSGIYVDQYKRISIFFNPPSTGFQPVIQVYNSSNTKTVTFYLDNFDVYLFQPGRYYSTDFLDGDENDPKTISITSGEIPAPLPTPTPIGISTPTPTFQPTSTPLIEPSSTSTPGSPPVSSPTPTQIPPSDTFREQEPNDIVQQAQDIGNLKVDGRMIVSGNVSKGGRLANGGYSGDSDLYKITLADLSDVSVDLDWSGSADLDIFILSSAGDILNSKIDAVKPISLSGTLIAGIYGVLVVSKDNPADYQFTVSAKKATPAYPDTVSLLNGRYFQDPSDLLFWYNFDGKGNYDYWGWNPISGDILDHTGTYVITFPYLILNHSDGTVERFILTFSGETVFYLNNIRYVKER